MCGRGLAEHDAERLEPGVQQGGDCFAAFLVSAALHARQHDCHAVDYLECAPPYSGPILCWAVDYCKQGREQNLCDLHASKKG